MRASHTGALLVGMLVCAISGSSQGEIYRCKTADGSIDRAVREANYASVMKKVAEQAYWVPLWTYAVSYAVSEDLDFTLDADEIARFFNASWK